MMPFTTKKKTMILAVVAVIVVAAPLSYFYYTHQNSQPLPQIGVQTFNNTKACYANKSIVCNGCTEFWPALTAYSDISEKGYKNSSITLTVLPNIFRFNSLSSLMRVWINGSLPPNLKPSSLLIKQSLQSPDVPSYVYALKREFLMASFANNINISLKNCTKGPGGINPCNYTFNPSANATMYIGESFVNDSLSSNTSMYHFSSYLLFSICATPFNINRSANGAANWRLFDLLPLNFMTGITITGLSKTIQEHIQFDILRRGS